VPSGRITDILNGRRSITANTAVRLGRYFGNRAQFWLDLQSQYDIAVIEREHGAEIARFDSACERSVTEGSFFMR
jgi:plasmid maintenance system antidote protein VapI